MPAVKALSPRAPGYGAASFLKVGAALRRDPLDFLMQLQRQYGDVARYQVGPQTAYLLSHPDHARQVLVDRSSHFTKTSRDYDLLKVALGNGLVTSEGDFWRRQRRIAQPAFHRQQIFGFGETMIDKTNAMLDRLRPENGAVDISHEMTRLTLAIIGSTVFSCDIDAEIDAIGEAVCVINRHVFEGMTSLFEWPLFLPTPRNFKMRAALAVLDRIFVDEIAKRRREPGKNDLLAMLMAAHDPETGEGMSDSQLRDEGVTMFIAGHETTANALAWCFYLLSKHPDVERRLRSELSTVTGGNRVRVEDLPKLPYLRQVIQETMRLYPPIWAITRQVTEREEIGGYVFNPGDDIVLSPYVTHRHPDFWKNPEGFDPDRFVDPSKIDKFAYFPFSGGPRQCIGNNFAMMEAQLIIATVLARYRLELVAGQRIEPQPLVSLRPRFGVQMMLRAI